MKKLLLLLLLTSAFISCSKDECKQDALSEQITSTRNMLTKVNVCHNGSTLSIDESALQSHLDHGDSEGDCNSLSDGGLHFDDGNVVEIDCKYNLPFIHVADDGSNWLFTSPN